MAKTRSMTRNENRDNDASSSRKRFKTRAPWSDLDHNLLFLVMMQLGVIDFLSFGGVCKSWRLLAVSNRNEFMASKPPMSIHIRFHNPYYKSCYLECCLEDLLEGRKFKTIIPSFSVGAFVGLTCGYLIFFMMTTFEFWLVNPITRHQLHFTDFPYIYDLRSKDIRAILVFSPSISGWVFVVSCKRSNKIQFSILGKGGWIYVWCTFFNNDLCAFKGKIYILSMDSLYPLCELRLIPQPKLTLFETKNLPTCYSFHPKFVSSSENLYVMGRTLEDPRRLLQLDFGEMEWVSAEKTMGEYAFFRSELKSCVAVKRELLADPPLYNWRDVEIDKTGETRFYSLGIWYFPHQCLNVDHIDSEI